MKEIAEIWEHIAGILSKEARNGQLDDPTGSKGAGTD